MKKFQDTETALQVFEDATTMYSKASDKGDYKVANKSYDRIVAAAAFLKQEGKIKLVSKFLDHALPGVRTWAAAYLLPIQEQDAMRVLGAVAGDEAGVHPTTRIDAEMTLAEWRKGNLKL